MFRSKYFRGKKILNEYDIRVEQVRVDRANCCLFELYSTVVQAEFSEISVSSYSDSGCLVDMDVNRGGGKVSRFDRLLLFALAAAEILLPVRLHPIPRGETAVFGDWMGPIESFGATL